MRHGFRASLQMRGLVLVASGPFLFALFPCCAEDFGGFGEVAASPHGFCCGSGISPWTTACCPCRYFAPAAETNFVHAAMRQHALLVSCIDSSSATAAVLGRGKALDYLMLSPLALRASRRDQF